MNQKTTKKRAEKKPDIFTINMFDKPVVKVLPEYSEADDAQKLRVCAMLAGFIGGQITAILDKPENTGG